MWGDHPASFTQPALCARIIKTHWGRDKMADTWWRHRMETFSAILNKRLSKQSRRRWFETPSRSLWRHGNYFYRRHFRMYIIAWKSSYFDSNFTKIDPNCSKLVSKCLIDNDSSLVGVMAWCFIGDKPLLEPMITQFIVAYKRHLASVF